ncbi:hypothetical protein [Myroides sp. LJL119]
MNTTKILWGFTVLLASLLVLQSCDKQTTGLDKQTAIARVNDIYLPNGALDVFGESLQGSKDSAAIVHRFIEKWATKELLTNVAEFNLSASKQAEINTLVNNFAQDLKIKAYLENMVQSKIDTVIGLKDLQNYYDLHKQSFLTEDLLLQLSYVNVLNDNANFKKIQKKFNSSNPQEKESLNELTLQMISYSLNDSLWVDVNYLYQKLPFLDVSNRDSYLKNSNKFEVVDQNSTYFVEIKQVKNKGEIIPFGYMKNALRAMIINDRKVKLIKQLQEDILNDAKNNKKYEVF